MHFLTEDAFRKETCVVYFALFVAKMYFRSEICGIFEGGNYPNLGERQRPGGEGRVCGWGDADAADPHALGGRPEGPACEGWM